MTVYGGRFTCAFYVHPRFYIVLPLLRCVHTKWHNVVRTGEKKMNAMDEKVMFRIPGDELAAFKRRVAADGLTVSVFLRIA